MGGGRHEGEGRGSTRTGTDSRTGWLCWPYTRKVALSEAESSTAKTRKGQRLRAAGTGLAAAVAPVLVPSSLSELPESEPPSSTAAAAEAALAWRLWNAMARSVWQ